MNEILRKQYLDDRLSISQLSSIYGVSPMTIHRKLIEFNIPRRPFVRRKCIFELPNFEIAEHQYWLGFILADGNVHFGNSTPVFQIGLSSKDHHHLVKLKEFLKFDGPIRLYTYKESGYRSSLFSIASRQLVELFQKYGISSKKSFTATIDKRLINNRHFWRGVIDGDGSIWFQQDKYVQFQLVGTYDVCQSFLQFVNTHQINSNTKVRKHKSIFAINFSGRKALDILRILYNDSKIYLDRKHSLYLKAESLYENINNG